MSFAKQIKIEIINKEFSKEEALIFINGIIFSSSEDKGRQTIIKINNDYFSDEIKDLLKKLKIPFNNWKENKNWIALEQQNKEYNIKIAGPFFAGAFFANGSISDINTSSYHLEIQFYEQRFAKKALNFLNNETVYFKFNWKLIQRRKMWVIYLKKSEEISDFLKAIGAQDAMLEFEEQKIQREFYNQVNRYNNLDIHNIKKVSASWSYFNDMYNYIKQNKLEYKFKKNELIFFDLRVKQPELSLTQLSTKLMKDFSINKTKSGLNHWLIKLRKLYEEKI